MTTKNGGRAARAVKAKKVAWTARRQEWVRREIATAIYTSGAVLPIELGGSTLEDRARAAVRGADALLRALAEEPTS